MSRLLRIGTNGKHEMLSVAQAATAVRDLLAGLVGGDRLSASSIQGLYPRNYRVNPVSFTGTTAANQLVASITFPGGTFQEGDRLHIFPQFSPRGSTSGTCTLILEFIHSGGTTTLFSNSATASQSRQVLRYLAFEAANISYHPDVSNSQPFSALGGSVVRTAIDLSQSSTLRAGFTISNAADVWWLNQLYAEHTRSIIL